MRLQKASQTQQSQAIPNNFSREDIWELSLIKTMLENPSIIENTLDYLDPSVLQFHSNEFTLVLQGQLEHPLLMKISLNSDIKTFNEDDLKNELLHFLRKYYSNELKKVKMQGNIPYDKKTFFIRQFTEKVNKLRRGELVPFGI